MSTNATAMIVGTKLIRRLPHLKKVIVTHYQDGFRHIGESARCPCKPSVEIQDGETIYHHKRYFSKTKQKQKL
jgi:hypothetical protein